LSKVMQQNQLMQS